MRVKNLSFLGLFLFLFLSADSTPVKHLGKGHPPKPLPYKENEKVDKHTQKENEEKTIVGIQKLKNEEQNTKKQNPNIKNHPKNKNTHPKIVLQPTPVDETETEMETGLGLQEPLKHHANNKPQNTKGTFQPEVKGEPVNEIEINGTEFDANDPDYQANMEESGPEMQEPRDTSDIASDSRSQEEIGGNDDLNSEYVEGGAENPNVSLSATEDPTDDGDSVKGHGNSLGSLNHMSDPSEEKGHKTTKERQEIHRHLNKTKGRNKQNQEQPLDTQSHKSDAEKQLQKAQNKEMEETNTPVEPNVPQNKPSHKSKEIQHNSQGNSSVNKKKATLKETKVQHKPNKDNQNNKKSENKKMWHPLQDGMSMIKNEKTQKTTNLDELPHEGNMAYAYDTNEYIEGNEDTEEFDKDTDEIEATEDSEDDETSIPKPKPKSDADHIKDAVQHVIDSPSANSPKGQQYSIDKVESYLADLQEEEQKKELAKNDVKNTKKEKLKKKKAEKVKNSKVATEGQEDVLEPVLQDELYKNSKSNTVAIVTVLLITIATIVIVLGAYLRKLSFGRRDYARAALLEASSGDDMQIFNRNTYHDDPTDRYDSWKYFDN